MRKSAPTWASRFSLRKVLRRSRVRARHVGEGAVLNLVVHIPQRGEEPELHAVSLAQRAPTFTMEWVNNERVGVAVFSSLPTGIDLALQLIGAAIHIDGAWASVNTKPISSLTKLWQRLDCFRESLVATDSKRYCREKSAMFNTLVGCDHDLCPVPCQFVCTPCMRMTQEGSHLPVLQRHDVAAALAEVDWCPNLRLSSKDLDQVSVSDMLIRLKQASS